MVLRWTQIRKNFNSAYVVCYLLKQENYLVVTTYFGQTSAISAVIEIFQIPFFIFDLK